MTDKENDKTEPMEGFEDVNISETPDFEKKDHTTEKSKREKKSRKEKKLQDDLLALQEKYDELNDKYLRLFSEFDNYRKRTIKERIELSKTASEEVVADLLTVLDDFDRAMQSIPKTDDSQAFTEGIQLIYNKFSRTLSLKGLEEMKAVGEVFDTDFHEALTTIPAPDEALKGKIIDVIQKGYLLNGKVIRFAKVVIGN